MFAGRIRAAVLQLNSASEIQKNLIRLEFFLKDAARQKVRFLVLPEVFASMAPDSMKPALAEEPASSSLLGFLSDQARNHQFYLCGGSVLLKSPSGRIWNASPFFGPDGRLLALYRKIHLFDAMVSDGRSYCESRVIEAGHELGQVSTPLGRIGLGICYDLRFPELFRAHSLKDIFAFCLPSAFTEVTGKKHWEILIRARSIENQVFFLAANQTGTSDHGLRCYGHSLICGPDGEILNQIAKNEGLAIADLDLEKLGRIRRDMPVLNHRRLRA